ncbi:MAG: hypothetical protein R2834_22675 [Rhodothermales bacterium]
MIRFLHVRMLLLVLAATLLAGPAWAQSSVRPSDLDGTWRLVFDLKGEGESAGERMLLNAVDGFLAEIDIRFEFRKDGELKVVTTAFDEDEPDIDYSTWAINDDGQLQLGDTGMLDSEDTVWLREGRRLVAFAYQDQGRLERKDGIYLTRVRD